MGRGGGVSKLHVSPWLRPGMREEMRSFSLKGGRLSQKRIWLFMSKTVLASGVPRNSPSLDRQAESFGGRT